MSASEVVFSAASHSEAVANSLGSEVSLMRHPDPGWRSNLNAGGSTTLSFLQRGLDSVEIEALQSIAPLGEVCDSVKGAM